MNTETLIERTLDEPVGHEPAPVVIRKIDISWGNMIGLMLKFAICLLPVSIILFLLGLSIVLGVMSP